MGDILSQNEIDRLLQQLNTGELDVKEFKIDTTEKKVRNHDFRRPSKFAKDHLRTIHIINENYARLLTNFLSGYLRLWCKWLYRPFRLCNTRNSPIR